MIILYKSLNYDNSLVYMYLIMFCLVEVLLLLSLVISSCVSYVVYSAAKATSNLDVIRCHVTFTIKQLLNI